MSTYWYYECRDHEPPIQSADEFTQHTGDVHYWGGVSLAHSRPLDHDMDPDWRTVGGYFEGNARRFLVDHPSCQLGLVNEYGGRAELPDAEAN